MVLVSFLFCLLTWACFCFGPSQICAFSLLINGPWSKKKVVKRRRSCQLYEFRLWIFIWESLGRVVVVLGMDVDIDGKYDLRLSQKHVEMYDISIIKN